MTDEPAHIDRPTRARRPRYSGTHPRRFEERYKELNPEDHPGICEHIRAQGRTPAGTHVPVMLAEVLACLAPQPGEIAADCTLGHGGHAWEIHQRIAPGGRLIGLDVDAAELERTGRRLGWPIWADGDVIEPHPAGARLHRSHFAGIAKVLAREGLSAADVILADLGVSSMQIDDPSRGFSYKYDGPLDMRMDDRLQRTAADVLASLSVDTLSACLRDLADEPDHRRIAEAIDRERAAGPITTARQLTRIILAAKRAKAAARKSGKRGMLQPAARSSTSTSTSDRQQAARTFQALRMLVNDETAGLAQLMRVAPYCLNPGGRIAIITFHSGEERIVASALRDGLQSGVYAAISTAPIRPTPREIAGNPRSRSAKLQWAVRAPSRE